MERLRVKKRREPLLSVQPFSGEKLRPGEARLPQQALSRARRCGERIFTARARQSRSRFYAQICLLRTRCVDSPIRWPCNKTTATYEKNPHTMRVRKLPGLDSNQQPSG